MTSSKYDLPVADQASILKGNIESFKRERFGHLRNLEVAQASPEIDVPEITDPEDESQVEANKLAQEKFDARKRSIDDANDAIAKIEAAIDASLEALPPEK